MVLIFYLFLGFCGFFLLVLLLSIVLISQTVEEEEVLIDGEYEDNDNNVENCETGTKIVRQSEERFNGFLCRIRKFLLSFCEVFFNILKLPVIFYRYCVQLTLEINNDFIIIE